ncbi:MAG: cupin domain-containing protein [Desulfatiglandales bacterium]
MADKEPYATEEEFKKRVVHYPDVPLTELVPGSTSHLVVGQRILVSFLTMPANSYFAPHRHEAEQIMIVLEGYVDEIIQGKLYSAKKGDVLILPSNIEHGAYIGEVDCRVIDIFSPPREDYLEKLKKTLEKAAK